MSSAAYARKALERVVPDEFREARLRRAVQMLTDKLEARGIDCADVVQALRER